MSKVIIAYLTISVFLIALLLVMDEEEVYGALVWVLDQVWAVLSILTRL